jgi:hypothetical protein
MTSEQLSVTEDVWTQDGETCVMMPCDNQNLKKFVLLSRLAGNELVFEEAKVST